jgi:hypothetical protein
MTKKETMRHRAPARLCLRLLTRVAAVLCAGCGSQSSSSRHESTTVQRPVINDAPSATVSPTAQVVLRGYRAEWTAFERASATADAFAPAFEVKAGERVTGKARCRSHRACRDALAAPARRPVRGSVCDPFAQKITEWVDRSQGRVRADVVHRKIQALGYHGSERTTRRVVAALKAEWRRSSASSQGVLAACTTRLASPQEMLPTGGRRRSAASVSVMTAGTWPSTSTAIRDTG